MKRLLFTLCALITTAVTLAQLQFDSKTKYHISCDAYEGFVAIGSYHGHEEVLYYVTDESITNDGCWYIEQREGGYAFRNAKTGQYLSFAPETYMDTCKYLELSDTGDDVEQLWNIYSGEYNGSSFVYVQTLHEMGYYFNLRTKNNLMGCYRNFTSNESNNRFQLIPIEEGEIEETEEPKQPDVEESTLVEHDNRYIYLLHKQNNITSLPLDYLRTFQLGENGHFTATLISGDELIYNNVISATEDFPIEMPTFTSYKFNNKFNHQLFTDVIATDPTSSQINLQVGGIGKRLTASFQLSDDNAIVWVGSTIQDSKVTRQRFEQPVTYTIGYPNWRELQLRKLTSGDYRNHFIPFGHRTQVSVDWLTEHSTNNYLVPEIYINTSDGAGITSKYDYKEATIEIRGGGVYPDMAETSLLIRGRGNTSWGGYGSKNPYRLKFDSKVKPLGMTKGKSWILLANKQTGSMTTNAIGHKIAQLMNTAGACHIVPVELYINGQYEGSYNLCEKIGFSNNSLNLDDDTHAAMIELDTYSDETQYYSNAYSLPAKIHDPDIEEADYSGVLTSDGIINDFNLMTRQLKQGNYDEYVDIEKLAAYLSTCELMVNSEFKHPKSVFLYSENVTDGLDPTGKDPTPWVFGPLWDCDWAFGYEQNHTYYQVEQVEDFFTNLIGWGSPKSFWNDLRYSSAEVDKAYYRLWNRFMTDGSFDELIEYCDDYYAYAAPSLSHNSSGHYAYDNSNYSTVTTNCKNWLKERAHSIFGKLNVYETPRIYQLGDINGDDQFTIADITALINIMLGFQFDIFGTADVNQDGYVSYADVEMLTQKVQR